ncbi:MAG: hypothetical protein ACOCZA_09265 [Spirochaetota bacterium]
MDKMDAYVRCRNCGKYVSQEQAYNNFFCSAECSQKYARCKNCGKFFLVSESPYSEFCSKECATSWDHALRDVPHYHDDEGAII